jgi:hypothetical protein
MKSWANEDLIKQIVETIQNNQYVFSTATIHDYFTEVDHGKFKDNLLIAVDRGLVYFDSEWRLYTK